MSEYESCVEIQGALAERATTRAVQEEEVLNSVRSGILIKGLRREERVILRKGTSEERVDF